MHICMCVRAQLAQLVQLAQLAQNTIHYAANKSTSIAYKPPLAAADSFHIVLQQRASMCMCLCVCTGNRPLFVGHAAAHPIG